MLEEQGVIESQLWFRKKSFDKPMARVPDGAFTNKSLRDREGRRNEQSRLIFQVNDEPDNAVTFKSKYPISEGSHRSCTVIETADEGVEQEEEDPMVLSQKGGSMSRLP
uniref:Uncharacterized protein n=1 Tax=Micrurus carvalhoi TaxID=3147026 RepID=A0A2H6N5J5_9SAUR